LLELFHALILHLDSALGLQVLRHRSVPLVCEELLDESEHLGVVLLAQLDSLQ
jgi:hypothetical protein